MCRGNENADTMRKIFHWLAYVVIGLVFLYQGGQLNRFWPLFGPVLGTLFGPVPGLLFGLLFNRGCEMPQKCLIL